MVKLPKNFRRKLDLQPVKEGVERRQEMVDDINHRGMYLPKSVDYEDMDSSFIEFIKGLNFEIDGEVVPVIFLTIQRWAEFARTWELGDNYKHVSVPFITIVRQPDPQPGQNQQGLWNVAGIPTYTYIKVPIWDGTRKGVDLYKVPQPVSVDITYEVKIFANKMRTLNKFNKMIHKLFRSRQHYVFPNEHPMPIVLETNADESNIDDIETRKFYIQNFEMKLMGYIVDEDEFEVVATPDRSIIFTEVEPKDMVRIRRVDTEGSEMINFVVVAKPLSASEFTTKLTLDARFHTQNVVQNITSVQYLLDGTPVSLPFIGRSGQDLKIIMERNVYALSKFFLIGDIL